MVHRLFLSVLLTICLVAGGANALDRYGRPGEAISLRVGYQPYFTSAWSGSVLRAKEFWKTTLPAGTQVTYVRAVQGNVVVAQMLADLMPIGYLGDMPTILSVSKPHLMDIRVVATAASSDHQCATLFVRNDAPAFSTPQDALHWLAGRRVTVPNGSCADRFLRTALATVDTVPSEFHNASAQAIFDGFKDGTVEAAAVWEPYGSRLLAQGLARRAAIGADFGIHDGAFIVMREVLMRERPDVAKGWLQAELAAQLYMSDPAHAAEVIGIIRADLPEVPAEVLAKALYGGTEGLQPCSARLPFALSADERTLMGQSTRFLYDIGLVPTATPREGMIDDGLARDILSEHHRNDAGCVPRLSKLPPLDDRQ
jgi:NitT/TauT family transport system substrate-binding protein